MKYYKKVIIEDKDLFKGITSYALSKHTKINQAYLSRVNSGHIIVSEKQYNKLKKIVDKTCNTLYNNN